MIKRTLYSINGDTVKSGLFGPRPLPLKLFQAKDCTQITIDSTVHKVAMKIFFLKKNVRDAPGNTQHLKTPYSELHLL